jgi:hypothetical protein
MMNTFHFIGLVGGAGAPKSLTAKSFFNHGWAGFIRMGRKA